VHLDTCEHIAGGIASRGKPLCVGVRETDAGCVCACKVRLADVADQHAALRLRGRGVKHQERAEQQREDGEREDGEEDEAARAVAIGTRLRAARGAAEGSRHQAGPPAETRT